MPEDKLTHRQRVRLEALAQTHGAIFIHFPGDGPRPDTTQVFAKAEEIEAWLLKAGADLN